MNPLVQDDGLVDGDDRREDVLQCRALGERALRTVGPVGPVLGGSSQDLYRKCFKHIHVLG